MKRATTNTSEISFDPKEGFLRVTSIKGKVLDLKEAQNDFEVASKLLDYKKVPVLANSSQALEHTKEARAFYASKEIGEKITAMAVLVDSTAMKLIANLFISFYKPLFPTKLFTSERSAVQWIKQFVK